MKPNEAMARPEESVLLITRVFNAPREVIWKAWTDPELIKQWWGPKNFTAPVSRVDLRVEGTYLNCMRSPEGRDYWSTGVYREIITLDRLVMTDSFADEKGNIVPASHYGMPGDWPLELLISIRFENMADRTKMTLEHSGIPSGDMADLTRSGWNESFDKLDAVIATKHRSYTAEPGKHEFLFIRVFDAPRTLVFKAYTDPKAIAHWWGPRRYETIVDKLELKPGGIWRIINRASDGREYAFHGVYHDIIPPERLVQTFEFEETPGKVSLEIATFEEHEGRTTLRGKAIYQSPEDRDGMLETGMEDGLEESLDRLAEYLDEHRHREKAA